MMQTKILIAITAMLLLVGAHEYDKVQAVNKAKHSVEQIYQVKLTQAELKAKNDSITLLTQSAQLKEQKDEQIKGINRKLDVALSQLRNRQERPTNYTPPTTVVQACSARELYREDAEFLTREAARADSIIVERDYYYNEYEKAREVINGISK